MHGPLQDPHQRPAAMDTLTPRDIFLARELTPDDAARLVERYGPRDGAAADQNLQQLADDLQSRLALGELAPTFCDILATTPDPDAAVVGFCRYVGARTPKASFVRELAADPRLLDILMQILGTSPFLSEILIRNPEYLYWLRQRLEAAPPDRVEYETELDRLLDNAETVERRVDILKRFQRREMLRVAARDLFGMLNRASLTTTTTQLSNLADTIVDRTLRIAAADAARRQGPLPGRFAVIGMGKLGGNDLNYSSDIDLIYVYDASPEEAGQAHGRYQKLGRRLTGLLSDHTGEGYLYRVDMRLRPMGQGGSLVYSLKQSRQYYESLGETFERFAMLKARPIAGDPELGRQFVEMVVPFVYRKYLDHAAIEELARYKARADREHARHGDLDINIKEGRGGIREVELFAQVFQLIHGGDQPALRTGHTLTALDQLGAHDFIDADVQSDLSTAYIFLRNIEHGLQAAEGQQTHSLSASARGLRALARRLGFDEIETLTSALDRHRDRVHAVYADLFHDQTGGEEGLAGRELFRLLAGEIDDEQGRARLAEAGIEHPGGALEAIRALDAAPSQGLSSTRNLLANLLAAILSGETTLAAPGQVLIRLERFVSRAGAPAALYRTLLENDGLRRRLLIGLDAGDLFAARLAAYPEVLDSLAADAPDPDAFRATVGVAFDAVVSADGDLPSRFDPFRRIQAIEEFKALAEWLTTRRLEPLNDKLSIVADCALRAAARAVARDLPPTPGAADPDAGWCVFALGKLGSRELTVHSDLDLVFVYDGETKDAPRFETHQKFVRAIQNLLAKKTAAGSAYEIDTRLRPEGKMGALAIPLPAFRRYVGERAEIWERMAWTRCRHVGGDRALAAEVRTIVDGFVYGPWSAEIPGYARHVRSRIEHELGRESAGDHLDLKRGRGGLADIDFLLQVLQIREGPARDGFRVAGTRWLLDALPATDFVPPDDVAALRRAYWLLRELETVLRIHTDSGGGAISTDPETVDPLARRLRESMSGAELLARYREITGQVRTIYEAGMERLERGPDAG